MTAQFVRKRRRGTNADGAVGRRRECQWWCLWREGGVVHSCQTGEEEMCFFLFIVLRVLLLVYLTRVLLWEAGRLARERRGNSRVWMQMWHRRKVGHVWQAVWKKYSSQFKARGEKRLKEGNCCEEEMLCQRSMTLARKRAPFIFWWGVTDVLEQRHWSGTRCLCALWHALSRSFTLWPEVRWLEPIVCGNIRLGCILRSEKGKAYSEDGTCPGNAGVGWVRAAATIVGPVVSTRLTIIDHYW